LKRTFVTLLVLALAIGMLIPMAVPAMAAVASHDGGATWADWGVDRDFQIVDNWSGSVVLSMTPTTPNIINDSETTSHNVTMPAAIDSGDLLIVLF